MKKLITLLTLFIGLMVYSQTPFPNGFRLPTAGEKEPLTDSIRIITMDEYGIVNGWVTRNSLGNGGSGGATAWGFITGTLSNQTDLLNALNSKQPMNMTLTGLSNLSVISNDMIYGTGTDTFGTFPTTIGGRALLNVAGTMNTFPYYSAVNTVNLAPLTTYARSLLDDPDASTARITLGLHGVASTGNYNDLINKPIIPAQFNPIAGTGITITGTYPNITFTASGGTSGTVTSVNTQLPDGSGNVELDSDDINEGTTNLYFTSSERSKLSGIEAGAEVNVNADWNAISGDTQILNKPIIPEQFNPTAGAGISITGTYPNMTFTATGGTSGTVTSVNSLLPDGGGNIELDSDDIDEGTTNLYFTSAERSKLAGIEAGAEVNVNSDWNAVSGDSQILNKPNLATVATSGDYNDLDNQPNIPTNTSDLVNDSGFLTSFTETDPTISAWAKASTKPTYTWGEITSKPTFHTVATSGDYEDLNNLPVLFSGDYGDLTNKPTIPAQLNAIAGTNMTITGTYPNLTFNSTGSGGGGDTNIIESISRNGTPITPDGSKNVDIPVFSTSGAGLVPARVGAVTTKFLREDGTWVTPTNTTYPAMTLANLNTGTATTANTISAQVLTNWLNGKISTVGFSGSYNDLTDKPTIPTTPNLTQVLTEGNLIDGYFGTVIEFENPYGANKSIFNDDGNLMFGDGNNGLILNDNGAIGLNSTVGLNLNNQTFPLTAGTNGQVLTTDGTNMSWTTPSSGATYTAGEGIDITSNEISLEPATDTTLGGVKIWKGTQNDYDALGTYDNNTLYYIETTPVKDRAVLTIESLKGIALPAMVGTTQETFTPIELFDFCPSADLDYIDWELTWKDGDTMYKASALGDYNLQLTWSSGSCFQITGQTMSTVQYHLGNVGSETRLILYY